MSTAENENNPPEENTDNANPAPEGAQEGRPEQAADPVAALEAELAEAKDRMMRALADAENTRKRALKDRDDAGKYAVASFARDLLDFSDNFGRAMASIPEDLKEADKRLDNVITGLDAMQRELLGVFDKHGVKKIEPLDEPFDPNYHEVMFEAPMPGKPPGTIIQVVEPGYVINDRLLRAAKVGIAKDGEPGGDAHKVDTKA